MFRFFKKPSLRENLLLIDLQITNKSSTLNSLNTLKYRLLLFFYIIIPSSIIILSYLNYHYNITIISIILIISLLFVYLLTSSSFKLLINYYNKNIQSLKNEQNKQILLLKQDNQYNEMLKIIKKYEKDNKKDDKDKSNISTISNTSKLKSLLFLDDPHNMIALICKKCGAHNGLVFPIQYKDKIFKCIECKTSNKCYIDEDDEEELEMSS